MSLAAILIVRQPNQSGLSLRLMKVGMPNIDSSQYGMPILHMEALQRSAEQIGPIGIRPVSKFALTFIQEGSPTKPFSVKNKSANSGPPAGLIAVDPQFARAPELNVRERALSFEERRALIATKQEVFDLNYRKQIKDAYEKDMLRDSEAALKGIDLKIKYTRIEELIKLDKSMKVEELEDSPYKYKITWGDIANPKTAFAKVDSDNSLSIFDSKNQPIQILGRSMIGGDRAVVEKGITADYDLLVVCPSHKDFEPGGKDKTPFRTQGLTQEAADTNKATVLLAAKRQAKSGPADNEPAESKSGGNWSERIKEAVDLINANISRFDPLRNGPEAATVHHNAEFNNPFCR